MRHETEKYLMELRLFGYRKIEPIKGCWLWTGAVMKNGYGVVGMYIGGRKGNRLVHRVSAWVFKDFDLLSDLQIMHKCDVRRCFNPNHIFEGTQLQNMQDMWQKGRGPNQHHPRKLKVEDVINIRRTYAGGGITTRTFAARLSLGKSTVEAIVNRRIWNHV